MPDHKDIYNGRINAVLDYIENHLDQNLGLERLARVAHFSPYHFHRIFSGIVGEPIYQYIRRIRLEKAGMLLLYHPQKSITEIALDCGFSSSATFARAFKDHFEMSATDWRSGGWKEYRKNRKLMSKEGKPKGKERKTVEISSAYLAGTIVNQNWKIMIDKKIKAQVEVKDLPEMTVAYVRHVGPYAGNEKVFETAFNKIMQWAGPRGLLRFPETKMVSVYHDYPETTEEDKLRTSIGITVPPGTPVQGAIGKLTLPAGKYAIARFELLPDEYAEAWDAVFGGWLPESGYQPTDGLCFENYLNNPEEHPEGKHIVEICVPVEPM